MERKKTATKLFVNQLIEPKKTITHRLRTVTHETIARVLTSI